MVVHLQEQALVSPLALQGKSDSLSQEAQMLRWKERIQHLIFPSLSPLLICMDSLAPRNMLLKMTSNFLGICMYIACQCSSSDLPPGFRECIPVCGSAGGIGTRQSPVARIVSRWLSGLDLIRLAHAAQACDLAAQIWPLCPSARCQAALTSQQKPMRSSGLSLAFA